MKKRFEDAFAAMEVELEKIRDKRGSHDVRLTAPPKRGIVSKVFRDEGYGFIAMEDGTEVYFHRNAVHDMAFEEVEDGMDVSLNAESGENGPQATTVNRVPLVTEHYADKGSPRDAHDTRRLTTGASDRSWFPLPDGIRNVL